MRSALREVEVREKRERVDHARRAHGRLRGDALASAIDEDATNAYCERAGDVPFVVVADHHRIARLDAERLERVAIDARVGFAGAELALDDDDVEVVLELVARELRALHGGV